MLSEGIVELVAELKDSYAGLSLKEMCEALGIQVCGYAMGKGADDCKGFFIRRFGVSCIMINTDLSERNRQIILAHEMGHACLHEEQAEAAEFIDISVNGNGGIREYEANVFAAEMLLSDEEVVALLAEGIPLDSVAAELEVPLALADYKVRILQKKGWPVKPFLYANSNFMKDVAG